MYLTSTLKRTLVIGGVSLLAVVGLIGWTRHEGTPPPTYTSNIGNPEPVSSSGYDQYGQPYTAEQPSYSRASNAPVVYGASPFGSEETSAYYRADVAPVAPPPALYQSAPPTAVYESAPPVRQAFVERRYYYTRRGHRYVVVHRRPFSHSVAIVAGSAAGGALIGGLAGGGKGAGIGALAGGAGGFIYDRLTHKKKRVVVVR